MVSRTFVYCGEFRFPEGDAASARVLGIARALRAYGCNVTFAGAEASGRTQDICEDGSHRFDGFTYCSQNELRTRKLGEVAKLRRYIQTGSNTVEWLKKQPKDSIDAVILYNSHTSYHARLYEYVKERGIPLVVDRTEWYDPGSCVGGRLGLFRWDVEATLRYWAPRADGVIAISSYLEKHFSSRGCHVLRVPPLVDVQEAKWPAQEKKQKSEAELEFAFAGHAGKKDYLVNAVRGLGLLGDSAKRVRFVLVGPARDELEANLGADAVLLEKYKDQFEFTGRLPHTQALARVAECDFSILLRPDARYAQAGFPTKLVESMGCGVPILGNLTSDMGMYVRDGIEGLVVENCSPEAFAGGVKRALALSPDQRQAMRIHARRRAQESFDYRNWSERLGGFMTAVLERKVQTF